MQIGEPFLITALRLLAGFLRWLNTALGPRTRAVAAVLLAPVGWTISGGAAMEIIIRETMSNTLNPDRVAVVAKSVFVVVCGTYLGGLSMRAITAIFAGRGAAEEKPAIQEPMREPAKHYPELGRWQQTAQAMEDRIADFDTPVTVLLPAMDGARSTIHITMRKLYYIKSLIRSQMESRPGKPVKVLYEWAGGGTSDNPTLTRPEVVELRNVFVQRGLAKLTPGNEVVMHHPAVVALLAWRSPALRR